MTRNPPTAARSAAWRRKTVVAALATAAVIASDGLATAGAPASPSQRARDVRALTPRMDANIQKTFRLPPGVSSWHDAAVLNGDYGQTARLRLALKLHFWSIAASAALRGGLGPNAGQP